MGFLKFLSNSLATKIGIVVGGEYKGCLIGFGTKDVSKKLTMNAKPDALIIFTKPNEFRFNSEDISEYSIHQTMAFKTVYSVTFNDGKKCLLEIDNKYKNTVEFALFK